MSSLTPQNLPPSIKALNDKPPQALIDLQQCVRERFAAFGLANFDQTEVAFAFEQPQANGVLNYNFVFPSGTAYGESYLGSYKQLSIEISLGHVGRDEDPAYNVNFDYRVTVETLFNNGYIAHPEDFVDYFNRHLSQWNNACIAGGLNPG